MRLVGGALQPARADVLLGVGEPRVRAPRTRLTEATSRAFFVFDRLGALEPAALEAAVAELTERLGPAARTHRVTLAAAAG